MRSSHVQIVHYGVLVFILFIGFQTLVYTQGNKLAQFFVGVVTALSYLGWGVIHHKLQGDLHRKVVVEYILMASIAMLLLAIVLGS